MADVNILGGRWVEDKPQKTLFEGEQMSPAEMQTMLLDINERLSILMKIMTENKR
jgi:hypothetical protein